MFVEQTIKNEANYQSRDLGPKEKQILRKKCK